MREARSATSLECVTMASVAPARLTRSSRREHLLLARGVEVAGRLVQQEHARADDERAGDRDALLLAARELGREVACAIGEADLAEAGEHAAAALPRGTPAYTSGSSTLR